MMLLCEQVIYKQTFLKPVTSKSEVVASDFDEAVVSVLNASIALYAVLLWRMVSSLISILKVSSFSFIYFKLFR